MQKNLLTGTETELNPHTKVKSAFVYSEHHLIKGSDLIRISCK